MSEAFIMRRGAADLAGAFALIAVSYPEGSTCTASSGQRTLRAKGTGGMYCFSIPTAGTWTITITDGEDTKTKQVTVAEGDAIAVTMTYSPDEFVLFSETGGLAQGYSTVGTASVLSDRVSLGAGAYITPAINLGPIDLTHYSKMTLTYKADYEPGHGIWGYVALDPDIMNKTRYDACAFSARPDKPTDLQSDVDFKEYEYDISGLNGNHYLGVYIAQLSFKSISFS